MSNEIVDRPTANPGLRERQKALARDAILAAAADVVEEDGLLEFSMPDIARRAAVSQRTVYNYFATRSALIDALLPWIAQTMERHGGSNTVGSLDELPGAVRTNVRIFGDLEGLTRALARVESGTEDAVTRDRAQRSRSFQELAEQGLPHLRPRHAQNIGAMLRVIAGSRSWDTLTTELGLGHDEAADIAAWTAEVIIAAARDLPAERGDA